MTLYKRLIARLSPIKFLTGAFLITLGLFALIGWSVWGTYRSHVLSSDQSSHLQELGHRINSGAEAQDVALRLAVASGDALGEQTYRKLGAQLDVAFGELATFDLAPDVRATIQRITAARATLATMDEQVFRWVQAGQADQARAMLVSSAYTTPQQSYRADLEQISQALRAQALTIIEHQRRTALLSMGLVGLTLVLLLLLWAAVLREADSYLVERRRVAAARQAESAYLLLLQTVTTAANEAISLEEAARTCLAQVCTLTGWEVGHLYLVSAEARDDLIPTAIWYLSDPPRFAPFQAITQITDIRRGIGLPGRVLATGQPEWVTRLTTPQMYPRVRVGEVLGLQAGFAFPILVGTTVVGVLEFFSLATTQPDAALLKVMSHLGNQLGRVAEREQASTALRHSETRHRALVEAVPDAILRIGIDAAVLDYKPAGSNDLLGVPAPAANATIYDLLPHMIAQQAMHYMWRALQTGAAQSFECQVGDERPRDCEIRVVVGGEEEALIILRDITERKNMDRLKNEFISTVSHELRTPLTSIRGSLGLIAGGVTGPIPPQAGALIDIALHNSERLVRLINDILDIEKIESGKMNFEMKPQPLLPLISGAIEANRAYAAQFGVSLTAAPPLPEVLIEVDSDRLTQVLTNLISNAAKFSPPGGTVDLAVACHGGTVRVSVTDHGRGIPEEFQQRIFQKFAQADSSDTRQKGGTGLGLSITRAIVERLGGSIGFQTAANVGTTFYFDLPEWVAPAAAGTAALPDAENAERILICEDDRDVATLLRILLAQEGYASDIAGDAAQAQALLAHNHYAAMTLDVLLPDKNGMNLADELRAQAHTQHLPIVIISATPELAQRPLTGTDGTISDWLTKPIDQVQLSAALRRAVRGEAAGRLRILHVEDDPDVRQVIEVLLHDRADLTPAPDLQRARRLLDQQAFDLILLDVGLPDGSGLDLLPRTAGVGAPPIPVVLFSAQEIEAAPSPGVVTTLLKSRTSNDELLAIVTSLMRETGSVILEQRAA